MELTIQEMKALRNVCREADKHHGELCLDDFPHLKKHWGTISKELYEFDLIDEDKDGNVYFKDDFGPIAIICRMEERIKETRKEAFIKGSMAVMTLISVLCAVISVVSGFL